MRGASSSSRSASMTSPSQMKRIAANYASWCADIGSTLDTSACGRGIRYADTSSPVFFAAVAPASMAALTAPTSPVMATVAYPPPTDSRPTISTFAAFTIASAASIAATRPRVSISPRAPSSPRPSLGLVPVGRLGRQVHVDVLGLHVLGQRLQAEVVPSARLLVAAERRLRRVDPVVVDPHRARLKRVRDAVRASGVARPDRCCQAVADVVGQPHRLLLAV